MTASSRKLTILSHEHDDFHHWGYFARFLIREWEKQGVHATVAQGTRLFAPADAVLSHVNLTVVPAEYRRFAARYPVAINGGATDISKRRVSSNLLGRASDWDGPVIVKTNLNYGGRPERVLVWAQSRLGRLYERIEQRLPWTWTGRLRFSDYQIYDRASDVPRMVWLNPMLVVERFTPERQGQFYCLRQWLFFGDRGINSIQYANEPIVKAAGVVRRERGLPVPAELAALRARLGFDYGKFDYVLSNDRVVLFDTNRTPTFSLNKPDSDAVPIAEHLAPGIHALWRPVEPA